jgi:hypothetical protein
METSPGYQTVPERGAEGTSAAVGLREVAMYCLRLGALGFGGRIALVGYAEGPS